MWIRLKIPSQVITGLNSFVILSLQPECKHGERWTLRFDSYWDHQVGIIEGQRDQAKYSFSE